MSDIPWERVLVSPATSIIEAMRLLDETALQIIIVVSDERQLLGTVTDGDIRRAILKGSNLKEPIDTVMNRRPTAFKADESRQDMLTAMRLLGFARVPIVDAQYRVVGLQILDKLLKPASKDNPVVLMAGGLGSRLAPLTQNCPKPLLPIGNQPVLQTILENFISFGFHRFYISVNYKAEMIKNYFGDGSRWEVAIDYIHEDKRMGTAGALSLLPERPQEPVFVMNGDILTKVNFLQLLDFHTEHRAIATMCAYRYELQIPYGVLKVDRYRLQEITEKPTQSFFVNAGIYVLDPQAFDHIPANTFFDMPSLFEKVIAAGQESAVFPIREYWLDIGKMSDFELAESEYTKIFGKKDA